MKLEQDSQGHNPEQLFPNTYMFAGSQKTFQQRCRSNQHKDSGLAFLSCYL